MIIKTRDVQRQGFLAFPAPDPAALKTEYEIRRGFFNIFIWVFTLESLGIVSNIFYR
jgi:hypothetical protein